MLRFMLLLVPLTLAWHSASAAVAEEPVPADRVMLVVRVPAQAKLTVESKRGMGTTVTLHLPGDVLGKEPNRLRVA